MHLLPMSLLAWCDDERRAEMAAKQSPVSMAEKDRIPPQLKKAAISRDLRTTT